MPRSAVAEIQRLIPKISGNLPWWERHAAQHHKLLAEILAAWRAGQFGPKRKTACRAIAQYLTANGIAIGMQGVQEWLTRNQPSPK